MSFLRTFLVVAVLCSMPDFSWSLPRLTSAAEEQPNENKPNVDPGANTTDRGAIPPIVGAFKVSFAKGVLSDQKSIWTSPFHLHLKDATWFVPLGFLTGGFIASDSDIIRQVPSSVSRMHFSRDLSNAGVAGLVGAAGTLYFRGAVANDEHSREAGLLGGQALINAIVVAEALKLATQRPRPNTAGGQGHFGAGGSSFPSEHAIAAWSVATVIANEYDGPLTKLFAYGTASAIALSRVTAREHFPSDVVVGSALGWAIGKYVYREHHDRDLGGANFGTFDRATVQRLRAPAELASPFVPLDSWVYAAVDRLAGRGYAPSAYANLRPWTRMECARIVTEIGGLVAGEDRTSSDAYKAYMALRDEFATEIQQQDGLRGADAQIESIYTRYTNISGTPLEDGYHFGQTLLNDNGRPYGEGANVIGGASGYATAGPVGFYVRGEFQHAAALSAYSIGVQQTLGTVDQTPPQLPIQTTAVNQFRLLDAYVAWNVKSVQLSIGRQSLWWGPNAGGPLMYSSNAEPMDMVRLSKTSPWKLPSFFSWLGPMRWEAFFGLMADHHYPVEPGIHGEKLSFKPTPNLELGFSRTVVFRPVTLGSLSRSFISVGNKPSDAPGSATDVGDRRGGFDFSYRLPHLRKWLVVYNDSLTDDDPSPLSAPRRAMMNPGVYLPQIPKIPKLDFRVETPFSDTPAVVQRGGHFFYWNGAYHDSYTNGGNLLGSWVGRQGHSLQLRSTYWFSARNTLQVGYREAAVDREFIPSGGHIQDFNVRATFVLGSSLQVSAFVQHERWNFPLLSSAPEANTTSSVELIYHPQLHKTSHK